MAIDAVVCVPYVVAAGYGRDDAVGIGQLRELSVAVNRQPKEYQ
jgi:hypothetical protein